MNPQIAAGEWAYPYPTPSTEPQMLQACRAGDEAAWQHLLDKYERLVYSVPLHYGLAREDAADVAKIAFVALMQSLDTLCDNSNLGGWLLLVARRHTWRVFRCRQHAAGGALKNATLTACFPDYSYEDELALAVLPPTLHSILMQYFVAYAQCKEQPSLFQRRRAALSADSLHCPTPTGLRASEDEAMRQYVYTIDLTDVALNVQPCWSGTHLDLIGHILPNSASLATAAFAVQLLHHEQEVAITLTDVVGGFWFEALKPGNYVLVLSTATLEVELPIFTLAF